LWRIAEGEPVREFVGHDFGVNDVALSRDGRRLLSASIDGSVRIWDLPSGKEVGIIQASQQPILTVAVSSDDRFVAAGGVDGRVGIWTLGDLKLVRVTEAATGPVWAVDFAEDDRTVLSGGADALVREWTPDGSGPSPQLAAAPSGSPHDGNDRGAALFRKCSACHTLTEDGGNKAGPTLYGLFGRRAGTVPDYPYSETLRESRLVWTESTVDELFRRGPDEYVPGSKMPLQRMPSARDRADLIEFLKRATTAEQ
jgi:cytochrome c